jgi:1-deoxy-D-xylulose-5-phosphate synthase
MITDLRALEPPQLPAFTKDLVDQVCARVCDKITHLESSVAVAELTVALHYVLNTPEDVLIWDVGHQAYIHKALTGRMEELANMRRPGGISGFLKREESPYDFFGAGHASTSVSALAGVCVADCAAGRERHCVAVIGDGSMTGGQSFEALNHLGSLGHDALVILNDNDGSIDPTMGALHAKGTYGEYVRSLGWSYTFMKEGNDVVALVEAIREQLVQDGPKILHIRTKRPDLSAPKSYKPGTTFQWWAAEAMRDILARNKDIQVLSPAMFAGSGFGPLREDFGDQFLDTGINEAHAVTTAAGIAAAGGRPWVHIYSTFLQRAYDQIVHDVVLQGLPVVFLVDRAGLVGADGPTHHGVFDQGLLMDLPGVVVWNPRNGEALRGMLQEVALNPPSGPLFIRYPKARTEGEHRANFAPYEWLSKADSKVLWVSTGAISDLIKNEGNHLHLAQVWPFLDDFGPILANFDEIHVFEESTGLGGLGGGITALVEDMVPRPKLVLHKLPFTFIEHGTRLSLLKEHGFDPLI